MKKATSMTIECKKVYYINDSELVEEIDKLIEKFNKEHDGSIQKLDGEDRPKQKPPSQ